MSDTPDHDELRQFLLEHVEDLAELEILAWFHRASEGAWAPEETLASALPFPADATAAALERLVRRGLVARSADKPAMLCFEARDAAFRELLRRAVEEYRANPVGFMALLTALSLERVRMAALRTFADCFRPSGGGR